MTGTFALLLALSLPGPRGPKASVDTAVFAGGCFWGIEGVFEHLKGVLTATAGYAGGHSGAPSYEEVSSGETGHAEAVRVVYDPSQVTYAQLLNVFFTVAHDPTELNRQGPDVGTNYRSVAFYRDSTQHAAITAYLADLERRHVYPRPVVTEVVPLAAFYEAEGYHQHYMEHHPEQPYIVYNDAPKVEALRRQFPTLYRAEWHD